MHIKYAASLKHLSNTPHKQPLLSKMSGASQAHGCQGRGLPILLAFVDLPAKMLCKFLKAIPLQMNFDTQKSPSPAAYFNKVAPLGLGSLSICTFGLFANLLCFSFGIFWLPLALWHWLGALPFRCRKLRLQFEPVGTEGAHGANALPGILNLCALCSSELCDLHWPWMAHLLWKHLQMIGPCVIVNSKHT